MKEKSADANLLTGLFFKLLPLCMPWSLISLHFACFAQTSERKKLAFILPLTDGALGVVICSFILIPLLKMNVLTIKI